MRRLYASKNQVACFVAVFSLTAYKALGLLYVDDADLAAVAKYTLESSKRVARRMQTMTVHW